MSNIGRCARCELSEMQDLHGDGVLHRMCIYYGKTCQCVARNCTAPPRGYRIIKIGKDGVREIG